MGSGFVWDKDGHIVTNNHVVDGATDITVIFADGHRETAKVVGQDRDADLAVLKVDNIGSATPLSLMNSDEAKVGQLAIAIGNPFGLEGSMTVGIISGLGRSLPVEATAPNGQTYTIPDVIQTDAAINPGNSGGVLVDDHGRVMGVTAALESPVRANAGVGFVIPANIVSRVVPELISKGSFAHPWLGISGTTLTGTLAKEMNLDVNQTGILVVEVLPNSPAANAGIKGGQREVQINGVPVQIGGDVIISIDGQPVKTFDDLASYLVNKGEVGKTIKLEVLRDGKKQTLDVTLAARPAQSQTASQQSNNNNGRMTGQAYLGISGFTVNSAVAQALGIDQQQTGVLVGQVQPDGPADTAGLQGGDKTITVDGQQILTGGDIIIAIDDHPITGMQELKTFLSHLNPGDTAKLTVLRNGQTMDLQVTLGEAPAQ
jgi:S1-C subfamily serine protease